VKGAESKIYNLTIAGLTANRNLTLPVASAAGKRINVNILDGDDTYAIILKGAATVTINGGSAATEWSRLFIKGESVTFRSTSTTNWVVESDCRIPCHWKAYDSSGGAWNNNTNTNAAFNAEDIDVGDCGDLTNDRFNLRRDGIYTYKVGVASANDVAALGPYLTIVGLQSVAGNITGQRMATLTVAARIISGDGNFITLSITTDGWVKPYVTQISTENTTFLASSTGYSFEIVETLH